MTFRGKQIDVKSLKDRRQVCERSQGAALCEVIMEVRMRFIFTAAEIDLVNREPW